MEMTIVELYNENKKMSPTDTEKQLLDSTLSLWTMGAYDATEEPTKEYMRKKLSDLVHK